MMIIDDFYPDLKWLFPYLNSQIPDKRTDVNYPGVLYHPPQDQLSYALNRIAKEWKLGQAVSELSQGEIRLTLKNDDGGFKTFIHTDEGFNVIIYLSGRDGQESGTSFYRHKQLNITSIHSEKKMLNKMAVVFEHDTMKIDEWDLIKQIEFKPNRAICFDGGYFHSIPSKFYGSDVASGRLTQNFFFKRA